MKKLLSISIILMLILGNAGVVSMFPLTIYMVVTGNNDLSPVCPLILGIWGTLAMMVVDTICVYEILPELGVKLRRKE